MGWNLRRQQTTGVRDISRLITNGTGAVYVNRVGDMVDLNVYGVTPDGGVSPALVQLFGSSGFPAGFRPPRSLTFAGVTSGSTSIEFVPRIFLGHTGRLDVNNPGAAVYAQASFITRDPWPTNLPGVSA